MESYKEIDESLVEVYNTEIAERKESFLFSVLLMVAGVLITLAGRQSAILSSVDTWQMLAYFVGVGLFLYGLLKFFIRKVHYVYLPTKEVMQRVELDLDAKSNGHVENVYAQGDYEELINYKTETNSSYRIVLYGTKSGEVYFSQMTKYVPFIFSPITDIVRNEGEKARELHNLLQRCA